MMQPIFLELLLERAWSRFKTAAIVASIFVILGAVIQGAGANHTLGKLGSVSTLAAAFTVALSAALTVYWMTKMSLPVSTSQAIVGAIIGWNFYTSNPTDLSTLSKIVYYLGIRTYFRWCVCHFLIYAGKKVYQKNKNPFTISGFIYKVWIVDCWCIWCI